VFLIRSITKPIGHMRDVLTQIGKYGDLQIPESVREELNRIAEGKDETAECSAELLKMVGRLHDVDKSLARVSGGDLTTAPSLLSERDTIGLAVVKMLDNLNREFSVIADSTGQINGNAGRLSADSQLLADGSRAQSDSIGNLSSFVTRVSQKVERNTSLSGEAANSMDGGRESARTATDKMSQMIQATEEINAASQNITKIVKVIDDIAFQTNILALNAAVEAARAGQHGKGFAVVADEVRNLAAKSAVAAKETNTLIAATAEKSALGASIAEETAKSLQEIVTGVESSNAMMTDISGLSQEQSADIMQIVQDVKYVEQIVEQNSAISSRSASAASDISGRASLLNDSVARFKFSGTSGQKPLEHHTEGENIDVA
jgi:methyl-accepting chemotaxis protein